MSRHCWPQFCGHCPSSHACCRTQQASHLAAPTLGGPARSHPGTCCGCCGCWRWLSAPAACMLAAEAWPAGLCLAGTACATSALRDPCKTAESRAGSAGVGSTDASAARAVGNPGLGAGSCSQVAMEQARLAAARMPAAWRRVEGSEDASHRCSSDCDCGCGCDSSEASSGLPGQTTSRACMPCGGWCTTPLALQARAPVAPRAGLPPSPLWLLLLVLELASAVCIQVRPPTAGLCERVGACTGAGGCVGSCHKDKTFASDSASFTTEIEHRGASRDWSILHFCASQPARALTSGKLPEQREALSGGNHPTDGLGLTIVGKGRALDSQRRMRLLTQRTFDAGTCFAHCSDLATAHLRAHTLIMKPCGGCHLPLNGPPHALSLYSKLASSTMHQCTGHPAQRICPCPTARSHSFAQLACSCKVKCSSVLCNLLLHPAGAKGYSLRTLPSSASGSTSCSRCSAASRTLCASSRNPWPRRM